MTRTRICYLIFESNTKAKVKEQVTRKKQQQQIEKWSRKLRINAPWRRLTLVCNWTDAKPCYIIKITFQQLWSALGRNAFQPLSVETVRHIFCEMRIRWTDKRKKREKKYEWITACKFQPFLNHQQHVNRIKMLKKKTAHSFEHNFFYGCFSSRNCFLCQIPLFSFPFHIHHKFAESIHFLFRLIHFGYFLVTSLYLFSLSLTISPAQNVWRIYFKPKTVYIFRLQERFTISFKFTQRNFNIKRGHWIHFD